MRSPATVEGVIRGLGGLPAQATPEEIERAVLSFAERTQVIEVGGGVVLLKLTSSDPAEALHGVRGLLDAFVREMLRLQRENVIASAEFLAHELQSLERDLTVLERRITAYRQEHADEVPEMRDATLAEHRSLRTALLDAEVRAQSTARQVASTEERLRALSPGERAIEGLLVEARTELARARSERGDAHPRVALARERVTRLRAELVEARSSAPVVDLDRLDAQTSTGRVDIGQEGGASADVLTSELLAYRSLLREREGAEAEAAMLRDRIGTSRTTLASSVAIEEELGRMLRELDARRAVHGALLERAEQARVMRDLALEGDV